MLENSLLEERQRKEENYLQNIVKKLIVADLYELLGIINFIENNVEKANKNVIKSIE